MNRSIRTAAVVGAVALVAVLVFAQQTKTQTSQTGQSSSSSSASSNGFGNGSGNATTAPWRDPSKEIYALIYSPGPSWQPNRSIYEQNLADHGKYMGELLKANVLLLGGPFKDSTGGMAIIQVNNINEAMIIAADDPAVRSRVMNVVAKPWHIVFERGTGIASTGSGGSGPSSSKSGTTAIGTKGGGSG